jgi:hypothetical protein
MLLRLCILFLNAPHTVCWYNLMCCTEAIEYNTEDSESKLDFTIK